QPDAVEQPDWPAGFVALARHDSRVYSVDVNGGETFYFNADPRQIAELIALFSKTRIRDHEVCIQRPEQRHAGFVKDVQYNVALHLTCGIVRFVESKKIPRIPSTPC